MEAFTAGLALPIVVSKVFSRNLYFFPRELSISSIRWVMKLF